MGLILKILIACHYFCIFLYHSESIVIPLWFIQRTQVLSEDDETIYSDDSFSSVYETDAKHEQFTGYSTQNSTQNNDPLGGKCLKSTVIKQCDKSLKLMSEADRFKNDFARGSEQSGAIRRKV